MRSFSLSVLLIFCFSFSFAQVHEISLNRKSSGQKSPSNSKSGLNFSFSHDKILTKSKTSKDGQLFTDIWLKSTYPNGEIGTPKLPAYKKLIRIPKGCRPIVTVESHSEELINLKEKGIELPIYPNQPSLRKDQDSTKVRFEIKKSVYDKNLFSNSPIATIEVLGNLRSATIARLVINPIDYNPVGGLIKVYNDIDVSVSFENMLSSSEEKAYDDKTYSPYFDVIYKSLEQPLKSPYSDHPDLTKHPVKMLIVSNRMFEQTLQPFIQWKKLIGFDVKTVYTDEIGATTNLIKSYITQVYDSATTESPAPTFLVIVGDVDQVPASFSGSPTYRFTDLYYASVDGDMFPDMYYGRLSATTPAELENILNKILYYEKYQFADPAYLNSVTLIAGSDGEWNPKVGQPTIKYGTANYFKQSNGFVNINEYGVESDPNNNNENSSYSGCYDANQIAVGFVNYTAHGSETSWVGPALSNSSISSFSNINKYPLVVGNCCLTGDFGTDECFGEAWIRAQNKGAVTYIGSSPNTYWYEDFYWAVGAFPMSGDNDGYVPSYQETTTGMYDAPFVSKYVTTGGMLFAGNLAVTEVNVQGYRSQSSPTYYWQAYNILGDPSLMPYFTSAEQNQVSHSSAITVGETSILINALEDSYIAISKDNQLLGTMYLTSTGSVSVPIIPTTTTGTIVVAVTRPQTIPYIDTIMAISPTGPFLMLDSYTVDDHLTNNNSKVDYNELFSTNLKIKNIGVEDATNVKIKVSGIDTYIAIQGIDSIGAANIPFSSGNNIVEVNNSFTFKTLENIPDQHLAEFTLTFYSDQGNWTSKLRILLNAPVLTLGSFKIDDILSGGNKDSLLNPGETCNVLVPIINHGHSLAKDISFQISLPDSLQSIASITNIQTEPFSLGANSLYNLPFIISAVSDIRSEPLVPLLFQASVSEPSGLSQTFEKSILINNSIRISNDTLSTCFTNFYDSGGKNGQYGNSENYTITFTAKEESRLLKVKFSEFRTENNYDFLYIYNGSNTNSPQITGSPFSGSTIPKEFASSGRSLTFRFTSDDNTTDNGWAATIECVELQIPECITTTTPSDGQQNVQSSKLTWDPALFATFYDVYIGSSYNNLVLSGRVDKPIFYFQPKKSRTYFWRVIPGNSLGSNNSNCNVWQFMTDTVCGIFMYTNTINVEIDTLYFYDSGGPLLAYKNNEDYIITFTAKDESTLLNVKFTEFKTEKDYDYLYIFNGSGTNFPLITGSPYNGTTMPNEFTSSGRSLTFRFTSDGSTTDKGWKAIVKSTGSNVAPIVTSDHLKVYPNPTSDVLMIETDQPITRVIVLNTLGSVVLSNNVSNLSQTTISLRSLTSGVYILIIYGENSVPKKALVIKK
jgi:hypothetical protein